MYKAILVKLGEIFVKKKNRQSFVNQLSANIKTKLNTKLRVFHDKLIVQYSQENLEKLRYVFGIQSYCPVLESTWEIGSLKQQVDVLVKSISPKSQAFTFKVTTKRACKTFPKSSDYMNKFVGAYVAEKTRWKVKLQNPDLNIFIEVFDQSIVIYHQKIKGLGGLPVGVNGKVLHLMSGGIDSPVAAWQMMKRGVRVEFLNFVTPPQTDHKTNEKVMRIIKVLNMYQDSSVLYKVNFSPLLNLLSLTSNEAYRIILMRRSFLRIANALAKQGRLAGISTGENLGQVASQTLSSLNVIQNVTSLPVYRPLLTLDKTEIIAKAKMLQLYDLSIEKARESCELFAPKFPVIKPVVWKALQLEKELPKLQVLEKQSVSHHTETMKVS